jgi:hypothetical protein
VGKAEVRTGVSMGTEEASGGGNTAPGVEQMVVVEATTVVDVTRTVAPAGQSGAFEHNVV